MEANIGTLRQQSAFCDSGTRLVIVSDDPAVKALDLRVVEVYPDTTDEHDKRGSTFKIKVVKREEAWLRTRSAPSDGGQSKPIPELGHGRSRSSSRRPRTRASRAGPAIPPCVTLSRARVSNWFQSVRDP